MGSNPIKGEMFTLPLGEVVVCPSAVEASISWIVHGSSRSWGKTPLRGIIPSIVDGQGWYLRGKSRFALNNNTFTNIKIDFYFYILREILAYVLV